MHDNKQKKAHNEKKALDIKTSSGDISRVFKGVGAIVFFVVMLFIVITKTKDIKNIQTSGWLTLAVIFVFGTLAGVKMSGFLEQKTNLSENTCMNISIVIVFSAIGGIVYLFWNQFFCSLFP